MATAHCLIRDVPHYRAEAFHAGLARAGFKVDRRTPMRPTRGDLLVIWNRYGINHHYAREFEKAGAAVVVVENGYLPMRGTDKTFAMALNQHNGAGRWPIDQDPVRAELLDVELMPWRERQYDILLLPQRGIGPPGVAMPRQWPHGAQLKLRTLTTRPVRLRPHPGTDKGVTPLSEDLTGVGCCATWGSGAAIKALCAGVPVYYEMPNWIGAPAASADISTAWCNEPWRRMGSREGMLARLAWAQWSVEEVRTGEPFMRLMEMHG